MTVVAVWAAPPTGGRALLAVVSGEGRGGHSAGTAYRAAVIA
jgi:hypothetical protein